MGNYEEFYLDDTAKSSFFGKMNNVKVSSGNEYKSKSRLGGELSNGLIVGSKGSTYINNCTISNVISTKALIYIDNNHLL